MDKNKLLHELAALAVKVGVNIQKGQLLVVDAPVEAFELVRMIVEEAYLSGASDVIVRYSDQVNNHAHFKHASNEVLCNVPDYVISQAHYFVDNKAANIIITSPNPDIYKDIDPAKMQMNRQAIGSKLAFFQQYRMASVGQWSIIAYPNEKWAKKVFPDYPDDVAYDMLLEAILKASRVEENGSVDGWGEHMDRLQKHNDILNEYNFKTLHFKNSLGTDLKIELVKDHIWSGGGEYSQSGTYFAPNIPTEETFTMPKRDGVNGKVVATLPLEYQGQLIEGFYLVFKDGKVVEYDAKVAKDALKSLIEFDEGSSRLGEVALISHDSPISNMSILFYNTLFDENASCHLALGNAYPQNIKDGNTTSEDELIKRGYNKSMVHVDFMFGSPDMEIIGTTQDGKEVAIFKKGNFVI